MSTVLHIQASPRAQRSCSSKVIEAFLDAYREENPEDEIQTLNLFERDLPAFDGPAIQAKYAIMHGEEHDTSQAEAWKAVEALTCEFLAADKYLLSVPMWNFGIPYRLKHYFDLIVQPGYTFSFDPETGYEGLVKDRPTLFVCSRGGAYPEGSEISALDHQVPYLKTILGFIGLSSPRSIVLEPTLAGGPDQAQAALAGAQEKAREIAKDF